MGGSVGHVTAALGVLAGVTACGQFGGQLETDATLCVSQAVCEQRATLLLLLTWQQPNRVQHALLEEAREQLRNLCANQGNVGSAVS